MLYEVITGIGKIPYGGDWNPEQWEESEWMKDLELLPKAGIDSYNFV